MSQNMMVWCDNQSYDKTTQQMNCLAHLAEGRVLICPFESNLQRVSADYPCMDFEDSHIAKLNVYPTILDGKARAKMILDEVREEIDMFHQGVHLAVILVGDNPASQVYVRNKMKDCAECKIEMEVYHLSANIRNSRLLDLIKRLNDDRSVAGILVQLPLPEHLDPQIVINTISPYKDVDCFHPENVGRMYQGKPRYLPCTPAGIIDLLDYHDIPVSGKNCVVLGRSDIVGKPISTLLMQKDGTVTTCHSKTENLGAIVRNADILISAVGLPNFVTEGMVKEGAVVIDVGMNRNKDGKLCGDVDFDTVSHKVSYITPVPGGVGPMTRAMLMKNTLIAARSL